MQNLLAGAASASNIWLTTADSDTSLRIKNSLPKFLHQLLRSKSHNLVANHRASRLQKASTGCPPAWPWYLWWSMGRCTPCQSSFPARQDSSIHMLVSTWLNHCLEILRAAPQQSPVHGPGSCPETRQVVHGDTKNPGSEPSVPN